MGTDNAKLAGLGNQKGVVLVLVALLLVVLLGLAGLVVDGGVMQVVRGELQNDSDAAALAGGVSLFPAGAGGGGILTPQWGDAQSAATDFVTKNKSTGYKGQNGPQALQTGDVSVGYWNLTWDPKSDHALTPSTTAASALTANDVPAVKVKVARAAGSNGGEVATTFMTVLGINSAAVSSRASVAVRGYAGSAPAGRLFPIAVSSCMVSDYFSQNPLPDPPPLVTVWSLYTKVPNCATGQWTSFDTDSNSAAVLKQLITTGNPDPLKTGDPIWIQPGVKATGYDTAQQLLDANPGGVILLLPIVDNSSDRQMDTHAATPIVGFAQFRLTVVDKAAKSVSGYFLSTLAVLPGSSSGGTPSNSVAMFPQLVQ